MKREFINSLISIFTGPVLSLITFYVGCTFDPLGVGRLDVSVVSVSFFISIIVLLVSQTITTQIEVSKATRRADRTYDAVRDYLDVVEIGTPANAWAYIMSQLPNLDVVQNTSFNYDREIERTNERLYKKQTYDESPSEISRYVKKGLTWKDIGDNCAITRFRRFEQAMKPNSRGTYEYRLIDNQYPQIGFIILTYKNGVNEVLFNWDFHQQNIAQDPKVLLSRESEIINMFASHYQNLWDCGVNDYDTIATKSTSKK